MTASSFEVSAIGTYDLVGQSFAVNTSSAGSGTHTVVFDMTGIADYGVTTVSRVFRSYRKVRPGELA